MASLARDYRPLSVCFLLGATNAGDTEVFTIKRVNIGVHG